MQESNNLRLVNNTFFLYIRTIFTMLISLYTSRVVLGTLGVEDFGIYNVVGGVVAMFGLVSGALSASVSRYLTIEMGRGGKESLKMIFSSALYIHLTLAVIIFVSSEIVGPWFITNHMTIPDERVSASLWVFHCSVLSFCINLISVPYNACIIAHEDMKQFAYISIFEACLKLLIVYLLLLFTYDKLALYAVLMLMVAIIIRMTYQVFCVKHYQECNFSWKYDWKQAKSMYGFAGWNMIGSTSVLLADQGVNILINVYCSPIVNAARGIAMQVNNAVYNFSSNFTTALNPQITKSYGAEDFIRFKNLMFMGSRLAVSLLIIVSVPIIVETPFILELWLGQVPSYSVNFVRLVLVFSISETMSNTFTTGLLATGKIKKLMLTVAIARMMNFPLSFLTLHIWGVPELTMIIAIAVSQFNLFLRLSLLKKYVCISFVDYFIKIWIPVFVTVSIPLLISSFVFVLCEAGWASFIIKLILSLLITVLCSAFIMCKSSERKYIINKVHNYIQKKHD